MRISHTELAAAAAKRLKVLLPSVSGLPGSVQAELFIIYSSLKYLSMELERGSGGGQAKAVAADTLRRSVEPLLCRHASPSASDEVVTRMAAVFARPTSTEPLSDHVVDVAAIIDLVEAGDMQFAEQERLMSLLAQYLFEINQADLTVYR